MSKKVHGSYFLDGRTGQTFITDDRDAGTDIGFRLAFDESSRVCKGGAWDESAFLVRARLRVGNVPGSCGGFLGIRLVADWRDT